MAERVKHLFQFQAAQISEAAKNEGAYHRKRLAYWEAELERATNRVAETARIEVVRQQHTGGWSPSVAVNYGDPASYQRMNQAASKIQAHQKAAERYDLDATLYLTQNERVYELDGDDVAHFRLNGQPREE